MKQRTGKHKNQESRAIDVAEQIPNMMARAIGYYKNGHLEQAEDFCRRILQIDSDQADVLHLLGLIAHQKKKTDTACDLISKAISKKPHIADFYNSIALVFADLGREKEAIEAYGQALQLRPDYAEAYFNLGKLFSDKGRLDEAIRHFSQALSIRPNYEKAYNNLGNVLYEKGEIEEAIKKYQQALRLKPDYVGAMNNLGNALRYKGDLDEAIQIFEHSIELNPSSAVTYCNLGNALKDLHRFEDAIENYEQAVRLKPDFIEAHFNLSIVFLLLGDFCRGWKEYEWRLKQFGKDTDYPNRYGLPIWAGSSLEGKTILVYDEQGLGDTLQFIRYLPLLKAMGGRVVFETRRSLIPLLEEFSGIDELEDRITCCNPKIACDYCIPLLSLPRIFKTTLATIPKEVPYLYAPPQKIENWSSRFSREGLRVGVTWTGKSVDISLDQFEPFAKIPGVSLYGLQKGGISERDRELAIKILVANLGDELKDFSDTAGVIENLDLVISIDTSVAHLAGAMGKAVWVLLPFVPDWRWLLKREDSPWYPTMRLFRQVRQGDWSDVIRCLLENLSGLAVKKLSIDGSLRNNNKATDLHSAGDTYFERGDFEKAITLYQDVLKIKPDFAEAYFSLGNVYQKKGDPEKAISCYQKAIDLEPEYFEAYFNIGSVYQEKGLLDQAISCYKNAVGVKHAFPYAYYNMGNALQDVRDFKGAVSCYEKAIELKPDYVQAYYNMGTAFQEMKDLKEAASCYEKALVLDPRNAKAYNNMGIVYSDLKRFDKAAYCYQKAIQLDPNFVQAYYNLGNLFLEQDDYDKTIYWYKKAIHLKPSDAEAHNNMGKLLQERCKLDEARPYFEKAIQIRPDYVEAHLNLSILHLLQGNFEKGWREYEWRFRKPDSYKIYPYHHDKSRWDGTPFAGRTLFVHSEQGLGDTLQFARYLPMVKERGGKVIFETMKSLIPLFQGFPGIDELVEFSPKGKLNIRFDFYIPLQSIPRIFQTSLETIPCDVPYIQADSVKTSYWEKRMPGEAYKIGIVWAGSPMHVNDGRRSCKLKHFAPLAQIPGLGLYSLQKGEAAGQLKDPEINLPLINMGEKLADFSDTAGVIENLDLVISVDTAVAHLAGAMGKPVWVLLPFLPDWRWMLQQEDCPWYPTMRLFRQRKLGDWDDVFKRVAEELSILLKTNSK